MPELRIAVAMRMLAGHLAVYDKPAALFTGSLKECHKYLQKTMLPRHHVNVGLAKLAHY
jgi:hypothetical protein